MTGGGSGLFGRLLDEDGVPAPKSEQTSGEPANETVVEDMLAPADDAIFADSFSNVRWHHLLTTRPDGAGSTESRPSESAFPADPFSPHPESPTFQTSWRSLALADNQTTDSATAELVTHIGPEDAEIAAPTSDGHRPSKRHISLERESETPDPSGSAAVSETEASEMAFAPSVPLTAQSSIAVADEPDHHTPRVERPHADLPTEPDAVAVVPRQARSSGTTNGAAVSDGIAQRNQPVRIDSPPVSPRNDTGAGATKAQNFVIASESSGAFELHASAIASTHAANTQKVVTQSEHSTEIGTAPSKPTHHATTSVDQVPPTESNASSAEAGRVSVDSVGGTGTAPAALARAAASGSPAPVTYEGRLVPSGTSETPQIPVASTARLEVKTIPNPPQFLQTPPGGLGQASTSNGFVAAEHAATETPPSELPHLGTRVSISRDDETPAASSMTTAQSGENLQGEGINAKTRLSSDPNLAGPERDLGQTETADEPATTTATPETRRLGSANMPDTPTSAQANRETPSAAISAPTGADTGGWVAPEAAAWNERNPVPGTLPPAPPVAAAAGQVSAALAGQPKPPAVRKASENDISLAPGAPTGSEQLTGSAATHVTATNARPEVIATPQQAPPVTQQIAIALQGAATGDTQIELALSPEELGHVRLRLHHSENGLSVSIVAERADTLDLLRRNIDLLARDFDSIGYADVSFSFGDQAPQDRPDQPNAETQTSNPRETMASATAFASPPQPDEPRSATSGLDLLL